MDTDETRLRTARNASKFFSADAYSIRVSSVPIRG
jgi:hypothetical protein